MKVIELPVSALRPAPWNPNAMDPAMAARLKTSIARFGLVENLVVRPKADGTFEVLSGNQRLTAVKNLRFTEAPCVVADLADADAMLLAQALNQIEGEDDQGRRAELMRRVLTSLSEDEVIAVLPESVESLRSLTSLGQDDLAASLNAWQKAQAARLEHLTFQLTEIQRRDVEKALGSVPTVDASETGNPNARGNVLHELCRQYLEVRSYE